MTQKITREDLEAKFKAVQDGVQSKVEDKKKNLVTGAAVGGLVLVLLFYFLGRRSGKKRTTLVEIRRV